jgi:hypothetical protein
MSTADPVVIEGVPEEPAADAPRSTTRLHRWAPWILAVIVLLSTSATMLAMRSTSTTFDEITAMAGGARGFETGDWSMLHDYPPVMQYLYGLPVYLSGVNYPAETRTDTVPHRYEYAQTLLWRSQNDSEKLIFRARLVAVAFVAVLILLTYYVTMCAFGVLPALIAGTLVAFLPDVLAHGGISYNDLPLAATFLAALIVVDGALRDPRPRMGVLAGVLVSLALGIKHSALALGPIAIVLFLLELGARRDDRRSWLPRALVTTVIAVGVGYLVQVMLYRGDFTLEYLRDSTLAASGHISGGHGVPAYLLGVMRQDAWWYFYPVVFMFKTPVALQILLLVSLLGAMRAWRGRDAHSILASRARPYLIGSVIFGALLLRANLTIGFRYALPLLPIVCILTAAGIAALWPTVSRVVRGAIVVLVAWSALSALSFYPHFIAYTSEHQPDPDRAYEVFVDSSLDWGQGLEELSAFMREENIDRILLSYFGSALPEGYGIDYIPLASFFPLPYRPLPENNQPRFVAVSATNLVGLYMNNDPYGPLRESEPYRVLGHTIYIYDLQTLQPNE